jgi:hypothetical protein
LRKARRTTFRRSIDIEAQVGNEEEDNGCGELDSGEPIPVSMIAPANIRSSVMAAKRLCACNCGKLVTRKTEKRHEAGQGPSHLMSSIIAQNQSLIRKTGRKKSSRPSLKQQIVGRPAPVRRALSLARDPAHNPTADEEFDRNDPPGNAHDPSQATPEGNSDLQMGEAGPSGVYNDPTKLSSPPFVPPLGADADAYGLSNLRRSHRIARCVEQVGLQRWGHNNHVRQFVIEESDQEDEVAEENHVMQEDWVMEDEDLDSDEDLQEDEDEMPGAEPGQEGVSVWDLLGDSFLKKASQLGASTSIHTFTDV